MGSPTARQGYRADAFQIHLQALGGQAYMAIDPGLIEVSHTTNAVSAERIRAHLGVLLRRQPKPTLICVQADMLTPAVYRCLADLGLRPQRDVAVISCNNEVRYLQALKPPPVVIDVQASLVGAYAVRTLLRRIAQPDDPPVQIAVRPRIAPR